MSEKTNTIIAAIIGAVGTIVAAIISGTFNYNQGYANGEMNAKKTNSILISESSQVSNNNIDLTRQSNSESSLIITESYFEDTDNESLLESSTVNKTEGSTDSTYSTPSLKMVDCKNSSTYEEFSGNGNNGFVMFGDTYTNGFTLSMGASFNMWGNGEQYVTYNIKSLSQEYSQIELLIGHIDGYESKDVIVQIYLDKTLDMNPDYEYVISPNTEPQIISIDITDKSSMTIQAINQGGDSNKIGFANPNFK